MTPCLRASGITLEHEGNAIGKLLKDVRNSDDDRVATDCETRGKLESPSKARQFGDLLPTPTHAGLSHEDVYRTESREAGSTHDCGVATDGDALAEADDLLDVGRNEYPVEWVEL